MDSDSARLPYPGLRPFTADESGIFFGREQQIDELLAKLQSHRFIAVTGPSGCGKSSLVKAGLIPALRAGFMLATGSRWRVCEVRPGQHPLHSLAVGLASPEVLGDEHDELPFLEAALRFGPLGLTQIVQESPLFGNASLLVVVDQFEEIFRFRERIDADEADAFVRLLLTSAVTPGVPIYIVITMRSDYLGDCALFHGLPEAINAGQYLTPRLTREQCGAAVIGPARVCDGDVDPALVNRLLNDFGPDPDQLPLLQHALMRMWSREVGQKAAGEISSLYLTIEDYEAVGGLAHALARHADEALAELTPAQQRLAELLFRRLTERGTGKRDTRAPARVGEIAAIAGVAVADIASVVKVFRGDRRHFVTAPDGDLNEETLLDIGHESLIRQWGTLTAWVDEEAESATTYKRLVDFAHLWKNNAAGLWRPPELDLAVEWQERQRPNAAWAARYASVAAFDVAMAFLQASRTEWAAEQARVARQAEDERQRERERIEQAAQRERLEALANAARAEAELERANAAAERQARRNRVLRVATWCLSAGIVALLTAIISSYYIYFAEHVSYYSAVVKKWGTPVGVGAPLTNAQVQGRESTFKIVTRGWRGPVIRIESVDGTGRFASQMGSTSAYLGDSNSSDQPQTAKWEYIYGSDEQVAYEVELDAHGRQLGSMVYMPGGDRNRRTAHFFGLDPGGQPLTSSQSCAEYVQIEYTKEGYEGRLRYLDRRGKPAPGRDHAFQLEMRYDGKGNQVQLISLDERGARMTDLYGNSVFNARYDDHGNQLEGSLHDEHETLTVGQEGYARQTSEYDRAGNMTHTAFFDEANRPTLVGDGWHRRSYERDANGKVVRERYWGIDGEPATSDGCHEFRMERDSLGRIETTRCIGPDGQPHAVTSIGVPVWRRAYDADGDHVVAWSYFDAAGVPIISNERFHRETVKLDDRGHVTELAYFGPDGASVMRDGGYTRISITYQGDKEASRMYFDTDGKPALMDGLYAERRQEYDRNGNQTLEAYFDVDGKPKPQANGAVAERSVYDDCGHLVETWYLGPNGKPTQTSDLYAGVRYDRDNLGRMRGVQYLSEGGAPTLSSSQIAGWSARLDARGNRIEETYFATDGRPIVHKDGYAAAVMTYDRRGNKTRVEYRRADGKPASALVFPIEEYSFNARNQRVGAVLSHFAADGALIGTKEVTYNDSGQPLEEASFDPQHRALAALPLDNRTCARIQYRYDAKGGVAERQCFGVEHAPAVEAAARR